MLPIRMAGFGSSQPFQPRYWLIAVLTTSSVERPRDAAVCLNAESRDGDKATVILGILMCSLVAAATVHWLSPPTDLLSPTSLRSCRETYPTRRRKPESHGVRRKG